MNLLNVISDKRRYVMNEAEREERARAKAMHMKLRAPLRGGGGRLDLLAWAFARGLPRRRCERTNHIQTVGGNPADAFGRLVASRAEAFEHHAPSPFAILERLKAAGWTVPTTPDDVKAWLASELGAIPAPVRVRKTRAEVAAAE